MSDSAVMTRVSVGHPEAGEYDPYYERYISLVPDEGVERLVRRSWIISPRSAAFHW